jgi:hypothetical protein
MKTPIGLRRDSSREKSEAQIGVLNLLFPDFIAVPLRKDQEPLAMRAQCVLGDSRHLARSLEHA